MTCWAVRPCWAVFQISSPPAFATLAIQQKLTKWPWGSENFFSRCRSLQRIDLKKVVFKHVPRPVVLLISNFEMMPIHWINLDAENGACQGHGTRKNETWMVHQTTTILIIPKTTATTPCEYSEVNFELLRATWVSTSKCSLQSCQLHSGDLGCKSCRECLPGLRKKLQGKWHNSPGYIHGILLSSIALLSVLEVQVSTGRSLKSIMTVESPEGSFGDMLFKHWGYRQPTIHWKEHIFFKNVSPKLNSTHPASSSISHFRISFLNKNQR